MTSTLDAHDLRSSTTPWIFDADGHVVEPTTVFDDLLPAKFRDHAPRVVQHDGWFEFRCGDRTSFRVPGTPASLGAPGQTPVVTTEPVSVSGANQAPPRLADMAVDRIDIAALYPTYGLMIQGVTEREPALALCRAINDWVADYASHDPSRLLGVATLPLTGAAAALGEAKRCIEDLGFRGVWRRPEPFGDLPRLQDDSYEPLWS